MKKLVLILTDESSATGFYKGYPRFLGERGWEVTVVSNSSGKLEAWARSEGATGYAIPYERNPSVVRDLKALAATVRLLRQLRPDAVVSATPKGALLGTLAAKLTGVPVRIYQLWGLRLETATGVMRKILTGSERAAIGAATQTVANSFSLARAAEDLGLAPRNSIEVLGAGSSHGVNLQYFDRSQAAAPDRETTAFLDRTTADLTIVFIGRITPDKGITTLLNGVAAARERGASIRLLLVGDIEHEASGRQIAAAPEYIHTVGLVEDVRPYIVAANVLCLPTLREGFPNVVLEAAALEVPAVVTDATGAIDSVVDGVTGWIFPVEDPQALSEVLVDITEHPEHIRERGLNARARVEEEFEQRYMWALQEENITQQLEPHLARTTSRDAK
ncbi:MAG TPA: glycosyltransferase family 4 protein [Enteractinococcus sp.]